MFCAKCGQENPDEVRFCASCGAPHDVVAEPREAGPYRSELHAGPKDISPRDLGQLINETFSVYGRAVGPFFAIAFIPELPNLLTIAVDGLTEGFLLLLSILLVIVSTGATIVCAGRVLTGQSADVALCYSRALNFVARLFFASLLIFLALAGPAILLALAPPAILVALAPPAILAFLVVSGLLFFFVFFTLEAIIFEGMSAVDALRRSRDLVRGSWWRLFGIGIVYVLLVLALALPGGIAVVIFETASPALATVVLGLVGALITPIFSIGSVLVYIDLRVRKEGYTLDTLASDLRPRTRNQ
jgi:hypothetical protein